MGRTATQIVQDMQRKRDIREREEREKEDANKKSYGPSLYLRMAAMTKANRELLVKARAARKVKKDRSVTEPAQSNENSLASEKISL